MGVRLARDSSTVLGKQQYVRAEGNEMLWKTEEAKEALKGVWGYLSLFLSCK